MKKSTLTPQDKEFLIKLSKSVDTTRLKQKFTETKLIALEHNIHALHARMSKREAQINQHGMTAEFTALLSGFTKENTQTEFFFESLKKLMKECHVKRLEGVIESG